MSLIPQNNFGPPVPAGPPQPPRQGAMARTFALMKSLMGGGFVLMLIVGAAEFLFAPEFKPSHLFGAFWGNVETNEIRAKQTATVDLARQQAEAAAKAQADAAKRAEIIGNTEGVKGFAAQVTDLACLAGQFFGTATNPDTRATGQTLKQACGAGDQIRNGMVKDLTGQGAATATEPDPGEEFAKAMRQAIQEEARKNQQPQPGQPAAATLPKAAPYKVIKAIPAPGPQQDAGAGKFRPYDPIAPP